MIKNQRQYQATQKQIANFSDAVTRMEASPRAEGISPRMHQAMIDGARSQLDTLREEVLGYEALLNGDTKTIHFKDLSDLPRALIKARIANGLNQKQLAEKVGVKPQQIQRWEQEDYENVEFGNMVRIAKALDLPIDATIEVHAEHHTKLVASRSEADPHGASTNTPVVTQPSWAVLNAQIFAALAARLHAQFGIVVGMDGSITRGTRAAPINRRFHRKLASHYNLDKAGSQNAYAKHLATIVAKLASENLPANAERFDSNVYQGSYSAEPSELKVVTKAVWQLATSLLPGTDPAVVRSVLTHVGNTPTIVRRRHRRAAYRNERSIRELSL